MDLFVIGAGGHAKVVLGTCRAAGIPVAGVVDEDPARIGSDFGGFTILASDVVPDGARAVIAIGDNRIRRKIAERMGLDWVTLIHPAAWVDPSAQIGSGTVIFAGAIVQADAKIGHHVIVNTSASVDHDCMVENYAHLAPGSRLCGGVRIGAGALLGVGSSVVPRASVGDWGIVGAGAAVVGDLPAHSLSIGVPARTTRRLA